MADLKERVEVLENFLYYRLNNDLSEATETLQNSSSRLEEIRTTISALKDLLLLPSSRNLLGKVDLGDGAFAQAIIPDAHKVFVKVFPSLYVELKPEEAIDLLGKLEHSVLEKANRHASNVARISAHIKLVKQAINKVDQHVWMRRKDALLLVMRDAIRYPVVGPELRK